MRILIIEDDKETARFIGRGLGELGHSVVHASNGRDGLYHAMDGELDVIVVDRMLPDLDGLCVLKALRGASNDTPVLMLTAVGGISDRVEGLTAGADDYLVNRHSPSGLPLDFKIA